MDSPTTDVLAALQSFADRNGRGWKDALSVLWGNGRDYYEPDGSTLHMVRNEFGPAWLYDHCTIKPRQPANVERHPTSKGFYIIYDAAGYTFRARRSGPDYWRAWPSHAGAGEDSRLFSSSSLYALAAKVGASSPSSYATRAFTEAT